ncbi:DNA (cytosine-5-)-methyltransferase [Simiduia curdlanivorans]|uniref:Cytosine-specific methyltransferase n=1 Tax=Simiduia curdlanivorans TaxID=1492769 RepID=A0ABV8V892_9GAMM|nr:DNA (cytosine-5-)-methyltransferase [Simiduia curdlanivorans]MDN3638773.1 DNA (cytosine-5-)-methyltransferase [Simiduia curdlanivorans]
MNQQAKNLHLNEALHLFELFDWWYPQKLVEETGLKADRVKYLIKLRKEFKTAAKENQSKLTIEQTYILENFSQGLSFHEYKKLQELLPTSVDGNKFLFVDLFAGIGGIRKPFSKVGGKCVLTCEWDEYAQKTYKANWQSCEEHQFVSDIKTITQPKDQDDTPLTGKKQANYIAKAMPDHDVLLAGFPCQPFSIAGVSKKNALNRVHGFDCPDQGQLFFDICRILMVKQPPVAVLENVKNLKSHNNGTTFQVIKEVISNLPDHQETLFSKKIFKDKQAYWIANLNDDKPDPKIIDGIHYVPQHRERIVLLCIRADIVKKLDLDKKIDLRDIPKPQSRPTLKDILEPNTKVDDKYTLTPKLWQYLYNYAAKHKAKGNGFGYGMVTRNTTDVTRTLSARYYKDGSEILINQDDMKTDKLKCGRPRRMTPQECSRLMGFVSKDEEFKIPVSDTRAYKQFGNSVVVPVFQAVADLISPYLTTIIKSNE